MRISRTFNTNFDCKNGFIGGGNDYDLETGFEPSIMFFILQHPISLLVIVTFASLLASVALGYILYQKQQYGKATGKVYDVQEISKITFEQDSPEKKYVLSYEFEAGSPRQLYSTKSETKLRYVIGDKVSLKYEKTNPNNATIMMIDYANLAKVVIFLSCVLILVHFYWVYLTRTADYDM